jgi:glycosyl transferase-like sugar-binding protein
MLWIGPRLSTLERLAMASFVANGHAVHLYTYEHVDGVPEGVDRLDAAEILPQSAVFTYADGFGKGSPSAFANRFRYKLLLERGGIYADADVVCLKPLAFAESMAHAVASERVLESQDVMLNGCFLKAPAGSEAMRECWEACAALDPSKVQWGETGPKLVTRVFAARGMRACALAPEVINPVDWWNAHRIPYLPLPQMPPTAHAVHCWNEVWRFHGLDKDASYPSAGAYETLKRRYGL